MQQQWRHVTWRTGADGELCSRFARVRVRPAHRDYWRAQPWPEQWPLIEWPRGAPEPTKYWLSTLGDNISLTELVRIAKLRWRIERDYQELKQELGLGDFEGRGWRGFHHHARLCIAAYGFLVGQRAQTEAPGSKHLPYPPISACAAPRAAPSVMSHTPYAHCATPEHPPDAHLGVLPLLLAPGTAALKISCLLTQ